MPKTIRPGDVLADRYHLVDLLNESGSGRFWRAQDRVLQRHVAVHVIESDGDRATALLDAARASATVLDRRLLRVLDADRADGVCFVVNEWGSGSSLDVMLAKDGPLGARRAAWIVSEVAGALAVAHERGVAHGRLVPENVLVDGAGTVRVIGCCVDAALHGLEARAERDVADLGGLLYCALTGKWPGPSASGVTPAPTEHDRVLRPRQVRAGIPRPLDALCDTVLNRGGSSGRDAHDLTTALGISEQLRDFVGDTTGMAEAEAAAQPALGQETVALPALRLPRPPEPLPAEPHRPPYGPSAAGAGAPDHPVPDDPVADDPVPDDEGGATAGDASADPGRRGVGAGAVGAPTEAGLPIFDDATDDVSWLTARSTPAPPPPPFEAPPERPLFAPEPDDGRPARRPRPGTPATRPRPPANPAPGVGYWPWETGTGALHHTGTGTGVPVVPAVGDEVPGRNWLRLALALGLGLVLLLAVVVAYNLGRGRTPLGAEPAGQSRRPSASPSRTAAPSPIEGLRAADLDPQGDPPSENPEVAPLAVDGNPATGWNTSTYTQNFGPAGLKTGVGLSVDLGRRQPVSSVDVTVAGGATAVSIYVTDAAPTGVRGLRPAASATVSTHSRLTLDAPVTGRYVVVWLTSLPFTEGGYRGEVDEVAVRG